ncbi:MULTISPECIES: hypothetical protein [Haloferacaceae]|uniref:Sialidase n=1 Tax=Halorubrum glutamatedens TaxID=2707018 RepID=A0ABD5QWN7_9EURY|nr:hypothetical protein [Halobellus captivus]
MIRRLVSVVLVFVLFLGILSGGSVGQEETQYVRGEPDIDVYTPNPVLNPGNTSTLMVQIANDGEVHSGSSAQREMVTTARSVTVEVVNRDELPFTIETQRQSIGTIPDGTVREVPLDMTVPADINPGEYSVDLRIRYSHTYQYSPRSGVVQERSPSISETIEVDINTGPRFEFTPVNSTVQIGGTGTLTTRVTNVGGEPAHDLTVHLESESTDLSVGGSSRTTGYLESLAEGENATLTFDVRVRDGTTFRNRSLTGSVEFTDRDGIRATGEDRSFGIQPSQEQRFSISVEEANFSAGEAGTLTTRVTNTGSEPARDLVVHLESDSSDISFGGSSQNTGYIDSLSQGETKILTYDVSTRDGTTFRNRSLSSYVEFTDPSGTRMTGGERSLGVHLAQDQRFNISVEEANLRVGESETIRGVIRNDGPADASSVVVNLGDTQFSPRSPNYSVGDLPAGASAPFEFSGTIPPSMDAIPQQIEVTTRYRTSTDDERVATDRIRVAVAERRDTLAIETVESPFVSGGEGVLELKVTNQRDVEIRDIHLRLAAEEPIQSDFRSTVIPSLQPGESDSVAFDIEVDSDAPPTRYPVTIGGEYTDPNDEQVTTRPETLALSVTNEGGSEFPVEMVILGLLLVIVTAGIWWVYLK